MGLVSFTKLTPEQIALLDLEAGKQYLTPKDKFDRLVKKLTGGCPQRVKKFHFFTVVSSDRVYLFDGKGKEIGDYENSLKGYRLARLKALDIFMKAEKPLGGFLFTPDRNLEYQNAEELSNQYSSVLRQLAYHPLKVCNKCGFDFEEQDYQIHRCILGKTWVIIL